MRRAERGLVDSELGGHLIKQRIPRGNRGAAKGASAVVFYRRGEIAVFLHIFAKSDKADLTKSELAEYLKLAKFLEELTATQLKDLSGMKGWKEITI